MGEEEKNASQFEMIELLKDINQFAILLEELVDNLLL
jgi:hypothetical protein